MNGQLSCQTQQGTGVAGTQGQVGTGSGSSQTQQGTGVAGTQGQVGTGTSTTTTSFISSLTHQKVPALHPKPNLTLLLPSTQLPLRRP